MQKLLRDAARALLLRKLLRLGQLPPSSLWSEIWLLWLLLSPLSSPFWHLWPFSCFAAPSLLRKARHLQISAVRHVLLVKHGSTILCKLHSTCHILGWVRWPRFPRLLSQYLSARSACHRSYITGHCSIHRSVEGKKGEDSEHWHIWKGLVGLVTETFG